MEVWQPFFLIFFKQKKNYTQKLEECQNQKPLVHHIYRHLIASLNLCVQRAEVFRFPNLRADDWLVRKCC